MAKDLDYIVRLEKAIAKKYGEEAIINPKSNWSESKEEKYLEQMKEFYKRDQKNRELCDKIDKDGFFIGKHLITNTKKNDRICLVCDVYSFDVKDDLYMNKFECCFNCYIQFIENREQRWLDGWRPEKLKEQENNGNYT